MNLNEIGSDEQVRYLRSLLNSGKNSLPFARIYDKAGPSLVSRPARQGVHKEILQPGKKEHRKPFGHRSSGSPWRGAEPQGIPPERRRFSGATRGPRRDIRQGMHPEGNGEGEVFQEQVAG